MTDDLNPDARRLVNLAREARTPGASDKMRIAERLAVPLAAGIAAGGAVGVAKAAAGTQIAGAGAKAAGASLAGGFGNIAAKIAALVAMGAVGTAVVVGQLEPQPNPADERSGATTTPMPRTATPSPEIAATEAALAQPPAAPEEDHPLDQKPNAIPPVQSVRSAPELAQEAALLHQAQSAWRAGQSAQALELANQHAERFPRSQLANERDVLRVLTLCKLGQVQAAKQVGASLMRKAKGSPWYQSVAESCAAD